MRHDIYFEEEPLELYPEADADEVFAPRLTGETRVQGMKHKQRKHVRWVQSSLNQIMNLRLAVDGIMCPQTRSAIRDFQRRRGLPVDGVVGPDTERALIVGGSRGDAQGGQSHNELIAELEVPDEDLYPWDSLILFRPSKDDVRWLAEEITLGQFQYLDDGRGELFVDYYPVTIRRLPRLDGKQLTDTQLLSHVRKNINEFVDTKNTRFTPYEGAKSNQRLRWLSEPPAQAVLHLDIYFPPGGVKIQDATVMLTKFTPHSWMFSTVFTWKNLAHPVCGNREFGISGPHDGPYGKGTYTVFTRGADRVHGIGEWIANVTRDAVFKGQDHLWRSFQQKVASFVNKHGGIADVRLPVNKRFNWEAIVKWRASACRLVRELETGTPASKYVCGPPPLAGRFYHVQRGDSLLTVTSKAYGVPSGARRLKLAQFINSNPYNHRFWRKPENDFERKNFSKGIISFNDRFSCSALEQINTAGSVPRGSCYARILIPPDPRD